MGKHSNIGWCDATHNFWYGCTKVSAACVNCYAERDMKRFGKDFDVVTRSKSFDEPRKWKEPLKIFVCSWSDFFHEDVPKEWRADALNVMAENYRHTYLLLTKRIENVIDMMPALFFASNPNVWLGVTVENQEMADLRIPLLLNIPVETKFVSAEPLLGPINFWKFATREETFGSMYDHRGTYPMYQALGITGTKKYHYGIDWIIAGGESGPKCRKMNQDDALYIKEQCKEAGVPFYFKQMSGTTKAQREAIPDNLQIKEFPNEHG